LGQDATEEAINEPSVLKIKRMEWFRVENLKRDSRKRC